jgi:hypothetical protein
MGEFDHAKIYLDSITTVNRLITSSLIILVLLTIVVEYRLYDEQLPLRETTGLLTEANGRLSAYRSRLSGVLDGLARGVLEDRAAIVRTAERAIQDADPESLTKVIAEIGVRRDTEAGKAEQQRDEDLLQDLGEAQRALQRLQLELNRFATDERKLAAEIKKLEDKVTALNQRQPASSIPTPFGTFDLPPRLALLLIAFASVAAFVAFFVARRSVTTAAVRAARGMGSPEAPPVAFWLYPMDSTFPSALRQETNAHWKLAASVLFQCAWFALSLFLAVECFLWNRDARFWYTSLTPVNYGLTSAVAVQAMLVAWQLLHLVPRAFYQPIAPASKYLGALLTRRQLLYGTVTAVAAVAGGRWLWLTGRFPLQIGLPTRDLVANGSSGVVHHSQICFRHLPKIVNRRRLNQVNAGRLHWSASSAILEELATTAPDSTAAEYLELAIRRSPGSVHLYDRLVKIYGRQRRYDRIVAILESGLAAAREILAGGDRTPPRLFRSAEGAVREFEARLNRTRQRAQRRQ